MATHEGTILTTLGGLLEYHQHIKYRINHYLEERFPKGSIVQFKTDDMSRSAEGRVIWARFKYHPEVLVTDPGTGKPRIVQLRDVLGWDDYKWEEGMKHEHEASGTDRS